MTVGDGGEGGGAKGGVPVTDLRGLCSQEGDSKFL